MKFIRLLLFVMLWAGTLLLVSETSFAQMMGNMREMMQKMMGDRLPPEIDPALLPAPNSAGASLLKKYCIQCHNLPGPGMHTASEWPAVTARMNGRMRMMSRTGMMMGEIVAPTEDEVNAITAYLVKYAQTPIAPGQYPLDSPAGKAFSFTCAQCHALPEPKQHTAEEWLSVVERMKRHEAEMERVVPDHATSEKIIDFLRRYGRNGN